MARADLIAEAAKQVTRMVDDMFEGRDQCVAACVLLREFLRERGVSTKLLAVRFLAANPTLAAWAGDDMERILDGTDAPEGSMLHAIGYSPEGEKVPADKFNGHMVMTSRNPDFLIDPTVRQAANEEHDLNFEGTVCNEFSRGAIRRFERGESAIVAKTEGGCLGVWIPAPDIDPRGGMGWDDEELRRNWPRVRAMLLGELAARVG